MKCWVCENEARGVCQFCGRGLCKDHAKKKTHIMGLFDEDKDVPKGVVVQNALFCEVCKPIPKAIAMPEIEGE